MERKFFNFRNIYSAYISPFIVFAFYIWSYLTLTKANSIIGYLITLLLIWQTDNILWIVDKFPVTEKKGSFVEENGALVISYGGKVFKADHVTALSLSKINFWTQGTKLRIECGSESVEFLSVYLRRSGVVEETDLYYMFDLILSQHPSLVQTKDTQGRPIKYSYKECIENTDLK